MLHFGKGDFLTKIKAVKHLRNRNLKFVFITLGLVWSQDILFSKMKVPLPNPSRPNPRQREKVNLISFFTLICGTSKGFMNVFNAFTKPFEAPQGGVKIKI